MLFANHLGVQLTAGGVQRIHSGVDTQRSDVTGQHHGGVQVSKSGGGRGVGQVIGWHVNGLDGSDRANLGGGNTLLQLTHFFSQGRLVAHGGRHTTQQSGHFGTGQCVAVDVVHEEQHVLAFVTERLSHGQAGQRHAQTVSWGLIHLTVNHGNLGLAQVLLVHNASVGHFVIEVVAFTGTLTHTSEHRQTAVGLGDVVDELHHVHGLAHAGTTEQTHLAALGERRDQVDHLDAGFQQFLRGRQFVVCRSLAVDGSGEALIHRTTFVDGVAQHVHDAAQRRLADWHGDRVAGVGHHQTALEAVGRTQSNGTHDAVTQQLLDFQNQRGAFELQGVIHLGHLVAWELNVHHGANTLNNLALYLSHLFAPEI
ncbi:hypothetical protein SDC9_60382 [bioreactor metagenome]|uniref:NAD-specific glutamate dehydrogenase n=1 Tax=bioreactor metagenome TaxID=1076179 RepID=A0A644XCW3_9ZZZZ